MLLRNTLLALAVSVAFASPAVSQQGETIETVAQEFLGIMKERGFADARYKSISGDEASFAITGFKGSKKTEAGLTTSFSIDSLTVDGLQPDDRWTRAEAVRADGVRLSSGQTVYEFGTIYANKAGILDIDGSRPSATFGTMILKGASVSFDGKAAFRLDEGYASADRWVGGYGVPGRLDLTVKGAASGAILASISPILATAVGGDLVPVEIRLKSSLADVRDELSVSAAVSAQSRGSWKASATLVNFDKGLFQSWFDLENPDEKRDAARQKKFDEAYAAERADIGLKSLSFSVEGLDWMTKGVRSQIASAPAVAAASALVGTTSANGLLRALDAVVAGASSFGLDGYARVPVKIGDAQMGKPEALEPLLFRFSAK